MDRVIVTSTGVRVPDYEHWLVGVVHHVLHGAAEEIRTGRMTVPDAGPVVVTTQSILAAPHGTRTRSPTVLGQLAHASGHLAVVGMPRVRS